MNPTNLDRASYWFIRAVRWGFWCGWIGGSTGLWLSYVLAESEPFAYKLGFGLGSAILGALVPGVPLMANAVWFLFLHVFGRGDSSG